MVQVCVVPGCNSGSRADIKQRTDDNIRKCSIFRAPKDALYRQQWSEILGLQLNDNSKVCELHFEYHDLLLSDNHVYVNGEWFVSIRERINLKKNSFPIRDLLNHDNYQGRKSREEAYCRLKKQLLDEKKRKQEVNTENDEGMRMDIDSDDTEIQDATMESYPVLNETNSVSNDNEISSSQSETAEEINFIQRFADFLGRSCLRQNWAWTQKDDGIVFTHFDFNIFEVRCYLHVHADNTFTIFLRDRTKFVNLSGITSVDSLENLTLILEYLDNQYLCVGISEQRRSDKCYTFAKSKGSRCAECTKDKIIIENRNRFNQSKYTNLVKSKDLLERKHNYCKEKYEETKRKIKELECQVDNSEANYKKKLLERLPEAQRDIVEMFITFANIDKNAIRYSRDWICECFLMRTKSTALYEYIRERGILPLPTANTLRAHTGSIDTTYGFHDAVFESLKIKVDCLQDEEKHGILLADEISLSEAVALDKNWLIQGYTDYGPHTPDKLKNKHADHALCLLFVPFRGGWAQPLAAFAATSTTGDILDDVLMECITRLENTGLKVDLVGMDGANVNRKVWTNYSVHEENISCTHPVDPKRRLWFISDASHLWKNFRTQIMKMAEFWTPDGIVKRAHWEAVIESESHLQYNLKCAYFLSPDHLNPQGYMTMNVLMAIQIFSERVYLAMEMYKNDDKARGKLEDCAATIAFIKRMKALIDAMRARTPNDALYMDKNCTTRKAITSFIAYLKEWKTGAKKNKQKFPLTQNTYTGLIVTLKATLEVLDYLHEECGYDYLLTNNLCSDPIERLFGILRIAAGSNDDPDPILFACLFKIFCTYGLIKSPKGSNVIKGDVLKVLANTKQSRALQLSNKNQLLNKLTLWICNYNGSFVVETDHIYGVVNTDDRLISDVSGWVVREIIKRNDCESCNLHLESYSSEAARHQLTNARELFGGLVRSSDEVFELIKMIENAVTYVIGTQKGICKNLMMRVIHHMVYRNCLVLVGCEMHTQNITFKFIVYFLERRLKMACKRHTIIHSAAKKKAKQLRKNAKLRTAK